MIGGATELHALVESGQLEQLLTKHSGKPALPDKLAKAVEDAKAQVSDISASACPAMRTPRPTAHPPWPHGAQAASDSALLPRQFSAERYAALKVLSQKLRGTLVEGAANVRTDRWPHHTWQQLSCVIHQCCLGSCAPMW